jgi:putative nucleotidyltransferase with HDIG domain
MYCEIRKIFTRCKKPSIVFNTLKDTELLDVLFPEMVPSIGLDQSAKTTHYLDLYQHTMFALDSIVETTDKVELIRVAALFHDIGKPHTETFTNRGRHFFNHEIIGKELAEQVLYKWGYPATFRKKVGLLISNHLFNLKSTDSKTAIKKFILRVGPDLIHSLLDLRIADINGVPQSKSLYQINNLRRKINEELTIISPKNAKLALSDDELSEILVNYTEPNLLDQSIARSKSFLLSKIFLGRVHNKKPNLRKTLKQVLEITCPLDKPHLLYTWESIQTGTSDTFQDGKLKCGVYCGFNCDKKLSK